MIIVENGNGNHFSFQRLWDDTQSLSLKRFNSFHNIRSTSCLLTFGLLTRDCNWGISSTLQASFEFLCSMRGTFVESKRLRSYSWPLAEDEGVSRSNWWSLHTPKGSRVPSTIIKALPLWTTTEECWTWSSPLSCWAFSGFGFSAIMSCSLMRPPGILKASFALPLLKPNPFLSTDITHCP